MRESCHRQLEYMKKIRRYLHQYPELSNKEFETSKLIQEELAGMGIPCKVIAGTGVVGLIEGSKPGKTVMLRADMDALAIEEKSGCEFSSKIPGVMHGCGHDGHTAALLGAAKVLSEMKDQIKGTVKLVFQPAEEYELGGRSMVQAGVLEDPAVDFAISHHLWGPLPKGKVGIKPKAIMAAPDVISFTIQGNGGHGAAPDVCTDTIWMATQAINMIYSRLPRKMNVFDESVLSFCSINGGNSYNVLPNQVKVVGTLRIFDIEVRKKVMNIIEDVLRCVTSLENAGYILETNSDNGPVINDPAVTETVRLSAVKTVGEENVIDMEIPDMGGEDFAFYAEKVPSCFFFVGISEDMDDQVVHHSPEFAWDDDLLEISCSVMAQSAIDILDRFSQ